MKKLMTAILNDGSQITGEEIFSSIHGDKVLLACDGQEISIQTHSCLAYFEETSPCVYAVLSETESYELNKLENLSSLLKHQAI